MAELFLIGLIVESTPINGALFFISLTLFFILIFPLLFAIVGGAGIEPALCLVILYGQKAICMSNEIKQITIDTT